MPTLSATRNRQAGTRLAVAFGRFWATLADRYNESFDENAEQEARVAMYVAVQAALPLDQDGEPGGGRPARPGTVCGHVFKKGEVVYRCRTCGMDDTCVLCAPCFNGSNHDGHQIFFSVSSGNGTALDRLPRCRAIPTHTQAGPSKRRWVAAWVGRTGGRVLRLWRRRGVAHRNPVQAAQSTTGHPGNGPGGGPGMGAGGP